SIDVHAEGNCPPGSYPIGGGATAGCAPIPGNGSGQQQAPSAPEPVWEDRWGAIAFDGPKFILGASAEFPSEQAAKSAALNHCKVKGGDNCQIEISYVNGCTAFTIGERNYYRGAMATLHQAVADGLKKCNETDKKCETYYSACSPPVRIR
ncbi:DUF4189 domain-containing protein, partial [Pectobacterium atrosepticum]